MVSVFLLPDMIPIPCSCIDFSVQYNTHQLGHKMFLTRSGYVPNVFRTCSEHVNMLTSSHSLTPARTLLSLCSVVFAARCGMHAPLYIFSYFNFSHCFYSHHSFLCRIAFPQPLTASGSPRIPCEFQMLVMLPLILLLCSSYKIFCRSESSSNSVPLSPAGQSKGEVLA